MRKIIRLTHFRLLTWLLLLLFMASNMILANHRLSHEINDFLIDSNIHSIAGSININHQNFVQESESRNHHSTHSKCDLCFASAIQNQLASFDLFAFLILFYGVLVARIKNYYTTKNYLDSSNLARSPPIFS